MLHLEGEYIRQRWWLFQACTSDEPIDMEIFDAEVERQKGNQRTESVLRIF
jgi:hypothetical protein